MWRTAPPRAASRPRSPAPTICPTPRRISPSMPSPLRARSTMRLPAWKKPRASAASRSASRTPFRPRSSASPFGQRRRKATASCWCRSARSRPGESRVELTDDKRVRSTYHRPPRRLPYPASVAQPMPHAQDHSQDRPYRACVGIMVLNRAGRVFIGARSGGDEQGDAAHGWQIPQGGVDRGEDPRQAALRELYEETNIRSVERLGEIEEWLTYDIPRELIGQAWGGKYRGQKQKWYAVRFTGDEREIDIAHPG